MLEKLMDFWNKGGLYVVRKYLHLPVVLRTILIPVYYVLFAIPYILMSLVMVLIFATKWKLDGTLTYTESFEALKRGFDNPELYLEEEES